MHADLINKIKRIVVSLLKIRSYLLYICYIYLLSLKFEPRPATFYNFLNPRLITSRTRQNAIVRWEPITRQARSSRQTMTQRPVPTSSPFTLTVSGLEVINHTFPVLSFVSSETATFLVGLRTKRVSSWIDGPYLT